MERACEASCGHAYCEYCIERWLQNNQNTCPVCRKTALPVHPSYALRSIIKALHPAARQRFTLRPLTPLQVKSRGNAAFSQGDFPEAVSLYSDSIELDAGDPTVFANRALCYSRLGQWEQALEDCEKALALDPGYVKVMVRKGLCHEALNHPTEALGALGKATECDKKGEWAAELAEATERVTKALAAAQVRSHSSSVPTGQQGQRGQQRGGEGGRGSRRRHSSVASSFRSRHKDCLVQ